MQIKFFLISILKSPLFYYLLAISGFFLAYFFFYWQEGFVFYGDFNPAVRLSDFLYTWSGKNLGYDSSSFLNSFFYSIFSYNSVKYFGLNAGTQIAYILPFIYFLSTVYWILVSVKIRPVYSCILTLLAFFNPITLGYMFFGGVDITFIGFANFVLVIYFLFRYLNDSKKFQTKYFLLSLLFSAIMMSVVYFFILALFLLVYFLYEFFQSENKKKVLTIALLYLCGLLLVSSYWIIPFVYSMFFQNGQSVVLSNNAGDLVLNSLMPFSKLADGLALHYYGVLSESLHFTKNLEVLIFTMLALLLGLTILKDQYRKYRKVTLFVLVVFALSAFLAKGPNQPFGGLFSFAFEHVPFFQGFRTYIRFCIIIMLSYIGLFALAYRLHDGSRIKQYLVTTLAIVMTAYFGYHFIFLKENKIQPQALPQSYQVLLKESNPKDVLTVDMPFNIYNQKHNWGETGILDRMSDRYFWYGYVGYIEDIDIRNILINDLNNFQNDRLGVERFKKLVGIVNIGRIVYHKDKEIVNPEVKVNSQKLIDDLVGEKILSKVDENDQFIVYEVDKANQIPHFYIPSKLLNSKNSILETLDSANFQAGMAIVNDSNIADTFEESASLSKLSFEKLNPTKYIIKITSSVKEMPLIFSESFNSEWKIYSTSGGDLEQYHFVSNGFSNGWILKSDEICGKSDSCKVENGSYNYQVTLEYQPQKLFSTGLWITGLALFSIISSICYLAIRKNR